VVIDDFHFPSVALAALALLPNKADPIPIVDPDAVLPGAIALETFERVARNPPKVGQRARQFR